MINKVSPRRKLHTSGHQCKTRTTKRNHWAGGFQLFLSTKRAAPPLNVTLKKSLPKQRGPLLTGKGQILCKEEDPENYRPWAHSQQTCGKSWLDPRGRSLLQKDVLSQPISVENGFTMVAFNQTQKRCKVPYLPAWCRLCCFSLWRLSFTSCFPSFLVATRISGPTAPGDTKIEQMAAL